MGQSAASVRLRASPPPRLCEKDVLERADARIHSRTSVMFVIRREPSTDERSGSAGRTRSRCSRIARRGRSTPAVSNKVSRRDSVMGEFAWIVVREPFVARVHRLEHVQVSAPRTSPTMIRSGRMRSAFRTSSRMRTSPWPSMFGGRASSVITCLLELELGGVLDRDDPLVARDEGRDRVQRRPPVPVPPRWRLPADAGEELGRLRRQRVERDQVVHRVRVARELPDRERRASERAAG